MKFERKYSVRRNNHLYSSGFIDSHEVGSKYHLSQDPTIATTIKNKVKDFAGFTGEVLFGRQKPLSYLNLAVQKGAISAQLAADMRKMILDADLTTEKEAGKIMAGMFAYQNFLYQHGDPETANAFSAALGDLMAAQQVPTEKIKLYTEQLQKLANSHTSSIELFRASLMERVYQTGRVPLSELQFPTGYDEEKFFVKRDGNGEDHIGSALEQIDFVSYTRGNDGSYRFIQEDGEVVTLNASKVYRQLEFRSERGQRKDIYNEDMTVQKSQLANQNAVAYWDGTSFIGEGGKPLDASISSNFRGEYKEGDIIDENGNVIKLDLIENIDYSVYYIQADKVKDIKYNSKNVNHDARWMYEGLNSMLGDEELAYKLTDVWTEKSGIDMLLNMVMVFFSNKGGDSEAFQSAKDFLGNKKAEDIGASDLQGVINRMPEDMRTKLGELIEVKGDKIVIKTKDPDTGDITETEITEISEADLQGLKLSFEVGGEENFMKELVNEKTGSGAMTPAEYFRYSLGMDEATNVVTYDVDENGEQVIRITKDEKQKLLATLADRGINVNDFFGNSAVISGNPDGEAMAKAMIEEFTNYAHEDVEFNAKIINPYRGAPNVKKSDAAELVDYSRAL